MNKVVWSWSDKEASMDDILAHVGPGWHDLVRKLIADLFNAGWDGQLAQIKEKFGGLRFYVESSNEELGKLIGQAENLSYKTCEECGKPGAPSRKRSWVKTVCEEHDI